ncbi:EHF [Mytilus coruscus]|uniref:EHF n=1 Tax=Mytilus coruscus TaxID=42192 RepID=A0A6J8A5P1_MYTCO|nr:EHF [Mytilus coruscus]
MLAPLLMASNRFGDVIVFSSSSRELRIVFFSKQIKLGYCSALTYQTMPNMYHPESSDSTVCTDEYLQGPRDFLNEDGYHDEPSSTTDEMENENVIYLHGLPYDIPSKDESKHLHIYAKSETALRPIPKVVPLYANEIREAEDFQKTTKHKHISSSKHNRQNGNIRLWQFLLCLLTNLKFNTSHIKWTNRSAGEFKILKSKEIARMWGEMKNNNGMTYEKMSRAMRNYYKDKILTPVPQRLVYKFGPMSDGW